MTVIPGGDGDGGDACGIELVQAFCSMTLRFPYHAMDQKNAIRLAVKVKLIWNLVSSEIKNMY